MLHVRSNMYGVSALLIVLLIWAPMATGEQPANDDFATEASAAANSSPANQPNDNGWHFTLSPYLYFPGLSGTVGAFGRNASVHASPGDILSHLGLGLMAAGEIQKKRFLIPFDFMWVKLEGDRSTPFNPGVSFINVVVKQTIFTPAVGYRVVDQDKLKVDARLGLRYWHLSQNLSFQPSGIFSNSSQSANWADVVAGAKFEGELSPKVFVTVLGDAGGGGADLDYEVAALLGLKVSRKVILQAGWRYLDVNYRPSSSNLFVYNVHQSGAIAGVTFRLK
jgi:hypothetical protein